MNTDDISRLASDSLREVVNEAGGLFPPSRYYAFLKLLAKEKKPVTSVVLGVCGGGDCLHLAQGWPEGFVVGIDIAYDHPEQIGHIQMACSNFAFYEGDSITSAAKVHELWGAVDILFVDTTHEEEQTLKEFNAWKPYLAAGAIVVFDDLFRPGMQEFWDSVTETKMRADFLHDGTYPNGGGFGIVLMP